MLCCFVHLNSALPGWYSRANQVEAATRLVSNSGGQLVTLDPWAAIQLLLRASSTHTALLKLHCSDLVHVSIMGSE